MCNIVTMFCKIAIEHLQRVLMMTISFQPEAWSVIEVKLLE